MKRVSSIRLTKCLALFVLALGQSANSGVPSMTQNVPPYAQDPHLPHPGTVKYVYLWNGSEKTKSVADVPEHIAFYCSNGQGVEVPRDKANWCIPIVEYETFSVDEKGDAAEPRKASFIRIEAFGPNHTFVKSTVTPPNFRRSPAEEPKSAPPAQQPPSSGSPHGLRDGFAGDGSVAERKEQVEGPSSLASSRLTCWQRICRALLG